ncbi:phage baseplate assembly protein domain-containing protein [Bosea sp. (in: a-proteobacteria)]|uniref:phage baseplate assembly protein domain-containing protein n=1 Tax=Bosea sp. (in: a-proteobacteria) TaxID=1871050 RepID=UPI003B3A9391
MRLVRFRVTGVDDSGPFQRVSGRGEGGETFDRLYRPQTDGLTTIPRIGALGYALFDGSRERGIVQGLEHAEDRPAGETGKVLYGPDGQKLRLKPGGEIEMKSKNGGAMTTVGDKLYLGGDPAAGHVFARVLTESGLSPFVFARVG